MPYPLEIRLPETGIVESVRVKLENAREKLAHLIVEKEDGERESPIIDVVESIEDCAIDNPDSITSAFFCIYSEYIQETTPKTMNPHIMPILEPNFVHSLNLAFLISISALSSKECLKNYTQYRNLAGSWEILECPCYVYDNNWNVVYEQAANSLSYDARKQNIIFAMVYCLCVKHPSNVEGSELKELLQFIYNSSKEIPQLIDKVFHYQTPLWYMKSKHTTSHKEETGAQRGRKRKALFNDEVKEQMAISLLMENLAKVTARMNVDVSETNMVNHFIITFALELRKQKEYQENVNSASIFRFLEKCQGINIDVAKDSYERFLRSYISENAEKTLSVAGRVKASVNEILDRLHKTE